MKIRIKKTQLIPANSKAPLTEYSLIRAAYIRGKIKVPTEVPLNATPEIGIRYHYNEPSMVLDIFIISIPFPY